MPGGPKEAYDLIAPIMKKCAAQVSDGACLTYLGPIGAGNYVKMVHNGIEYGDMQLISEVYDVLKVRDNFRFLLFDRFCSVKFPTVIHGTFFLIAENCLHVKPRDV